MGGVVCRGFSFNFVGLGTWRLIIFLLGRRIFVDKIRALLSQSKKKKKKSVGLEETEEAQEEKHIKSLNDHFSGISKLSKPL